MRNHVVVNAGTKGLFPKARFVFGERLPSALHQAPIPRLPAMPGLLASKQHQGSSAVPTESLTLSVGGQAFEQQLPILGFAVPKRSLSATLRRP
jgi:hypothetical protein